MAERPRQSIRPDWMDQLSGRSLSAREYGDACFAWFDRRLDAYRRSLRSRGADRDPILDLSGEEVGRELDRTIADAEARKMIERFAAGEPWDRIKADALGPEAQAS